MQRRQLMGAVLAAATACAGLIGASAAHAQGPVTLRYATFLPPGGLRLRLTAQDIFRAGAD